MHARQSCQGGVLNPEILPYYEENEEISIGKRFLPISQECQNYDMIRKIKSLKYENTVPSSMNGATAQSKNRVKRLEERNMDVIEEQSVVSSDIPVREKYLHLLPTYWGAKFTLEQRYLIKIQAKVDEILDFLRLNRQKTKGQYFSVIRKSLLEGSDINLEMENFKQILFIKPDFYHFSQKREDERKLDILITLPYDCDLATRKNQFRKAMYDYVLKHQGFEDQKRIKIPTFEFSFTKKQQTTKKTIYQSLKEANSFTSSKLFNFNHKGILSGVIDPRQALLKGNKQNFQLALMQKIRENQQRIKQEREKPQQVKYGCKQILMVLDQIPQIFKRRAKSSMFKSSIITDIDKVLPFSVQVISKILQKIIEENPKFVHRIDHPSGQILQLQKKNYNEVRREIQAKQKSDSPSQKQNSQNQKDKNTMEQPKTQKKVPNKQYQLHSKTPSKLFSKNREDMEKTALKKQNESHNTYPIVDVTKILMKARSKKLIKS